MIPNYENAARRAADVLGKYETNDPLRVLQKMDNVLLISISNDASYSIKLDAVSIMSRSASKARYIVIYNTNVSHIRLRFALARELGRIALEHDDQIEEDIREEEAASFAHYFLCPLTFPVKSIKINYKPKHQSLLWEMKSICVFESIEKMKSHIAEEKNKINRFIGKKAAQYDSSDVKLSSRTAFDSLTGWKNCYNVILDGQTIGYCGE